MNAHRGILGHSAWQGNGASCCNGPNNSGNNGMKGRLTLGAAAEGIPCTVPSDLENTSKADRGSAQRHVRPPFLQSRCLVGALLSAAPHIGLAGRLPGGPEREIMLFTLAGAE